jgi:hypothetical protein
MKSLALRRKQHRDRIARLNRTTRDTELTEQCDALGPYARNLEEIRERARKHFRITPEESARRAELRKAWISQNAENSSPEGTPDDSPATSVPGNLATIDSVPEGRLNSSMAESISPRPTISDSQFSIPNSQSAPSPINQSSIIPNQFSARRAELRKAWISQNAENSSPEGTPADSPATSVPGNLATIDSVPEGRLNSSMAESISPRPTISDSQFSIPNSQSAPSPINQSSIIPNQLTLTNLKPYPNP